MDPLWVLAAFVFGAASSRVGLPPLVGYMIAGFALNSFGIEGSETLVRIADAGVTLLLFSIGLKLKLKSLAKPEVWAGATIHMLITVVVFGVRNLDSWCYQGFPTFISLSWQTATLIAFALSFSSTVFAVKVLEERKEMAARHAAAADRYPDHAGHYCGCFSNGLFREVPLALVSGACRCHFLSSGRLLARFMVRCGHGELLMLFGILMTTTGYISFELVELKGDLGALGLSVCCWATHPKGERTG